jgi:serine/threonine-protein kinase
LTRTSDGSHVVKLIDFGISKMTGPEGAGEIQVTGSAIMMGSPLYMAPEQMKSARDVDARVDVWSMGGILYLLMTGSPPFPGETVMGIYEKILEGVPRLERAVAGVPAALGDVVVRCLQRDANQRYPDVAALALALAPFAAPGASADRAQRAARILAGRAGSASGLAPGVALTQAPGPYGFQPAASPPAGAEAAAPPPSVHMGPLVAPSVTPPAARSGPGAASVGPWNAQPAAPRRTGWFVGAAILAGLVAAAAVVATMTRTRRGVDAAATPDLAASAAPALAASTSASAPAASIAVAPSAPVEAPSSSASAAPDSPSDSAAASATAAPRPQVPHAPGKAKPITAKPKRDLFNDPQ